MRRHIILRVAAKALIPLIMLFAFYVQFHGDYGPGGGFQAGVILAAALVLYALIFGLDAARAVATVQVVRIALSAGVLIYAGVGVATLVLGGNYLDYGVLDHHEPSHGHHLGILLVEGGVGITVTAAMLTIFYAFADRARVAMREREGEHHGEAG
jgi:multicomponent Na+:H+ antiporter subunit B